LRICVIIPNFNGETMIGTCLDSLSAQTRPPDRVTVVDNGSTDRSRQIVAGHSIGAELIALESNLGFAAAVNRGIEKADGDAVALLNNDATADPRWIEAGLAAMEINPGVSMFASLMLDYQDHHLVDSAGDLYPRDGRPRPRGRGESASLYKEPVEVFSACAGAAFFRKELFEELGGFEESFFAYLEDVDLGFRARARGHACLFAPEAIVYHAGAATDLGDLPGGKPVDSSERVYWIARNRVRVVSRNWPAGLIIGWSPWLAFGLFRSAAYHVFISRRAGAFFKGIIRGFSSIPGDRAFFRNEMKARQSDRGDTPRPGPQPPSGAYKKITRLMRHGAQPWAQ
jgi:GT2 family glycosyltransferase